MPTELKRWRKAYTFGIVENERSIHAAGYG
jgi:hypothetical protein